MHTCVPSPGNSKGLLIRGPWLRHLLAVFTEIPLLTRPPPPCPQSPGFIKWQEPFVQCCQQWDHFLHLNHMPFDWLCLFRSRKCHNEEPALHFFLASCLDYHSKWIKTCCFILAHCLNWWPQSLQLGTGILLNIVQCAGHPPTRKNYLVPNTNSAEALGEHGPVPSPQPAFSWRTLLIQK